MKKMCNLQNRGEDNAECWNKSIGNVLKVAILIKVQTSTWNSLGIQHTSGGKELIESLNKRLYINILLFGSFRK